MPRKSKEKKQPEPKGKPPALAISILAGLIVACISTAVNLISRAVLLLLYGNQLTLAVAQSNISGIITELIAIAVLFFLMYRQYKKVKLLSS